MQTKHTAESLVGLKFGRLTIIKAERKESKNKKHKFWYCTCLCMCGNTKTIAYNSLQAGKTKSCGCLHKEILAEKKQTHGMSKTPEYAIWEGIRSRCNCPTASGYDLYGGRGIKVCSKWDNFQAFYEDMGPRPSPKHSIDRIDTNGNYSPENCRWSIKKEQERNKRNNIYIEIDGRKTLLIEECEKRGFSYSVAKERLKLGWSIKTLFSTPIRKRRKN